MQPIYTHSNHIHPRKPHNLSTRPTRPTPRIQPSHPGLQPHNVRQEMLMSRQSRIDTLRGIRKWAEME